MCCSGHCPCPGPACSWVVQKVHTSWNIQLVRVFVCGPVARWHNAITCILVLRHHCFPSVATGIPHAGVTSPAFRASDPGTPVLTSLVCLVLEMSTHSFKIDDDVVVASPMLKRMRIDGLDRATVPFAKRHFLAWRGMPKPNLDAATLIHIVKVLSRTLLSPKTCPA